jgi:transcription termination factor NusB
VQKTFQILEAKNLFCTNFGKSKILGSSKHQNVKTSKGQFSANKIGQQCQAFQKHVQTCLPNMSKHVAKHLPNINKNILTLAYYSLHYGKNISTLINFPTI